MNPHPASRESSDIVSDMERGLVQDEFFFVFQPKLRTSDGRLSGFESLMRWQHPVSGVLEPSSFISVVEHSELSGRFTDMLLTRACDTLADWTARGHDGLTLAVNLPASELACADLPGKLRALLAARRLPPGRLQIELTGVVEPDRLDFLSHAINAVRASGVSVALDDFGAGLTSLTLLHQLPVDILKIDRSFVARVPGDTESTLVLETLIRLGQRLGKQIVLEGIETEAQFRWSRTLPQVDCQGYYISRPVREAWVEPLIALHGHLYGQTKAKPDSVRPDHPEPMRN